MADRTNGRRVRSDLQARLMRLHQRWFLIVQVSLAAALAWFLANDVLGHDRPFFAPIAAIVSLGLSYGQRLRRVGEVTAGVAVGVAVADVFVLVAGTGVWQVALVVLISMIVAVLLDGGPLIVIQAAVQSVVVITLLPMASEGFNRWLDAVVGGAVALVAAAIAPQTPLRRPREEAGRVLDDLAGLLGDSAAAGRAGDPRLAAAALARARATDSGLEDLRTAAAEGLAVARSSPFRRRQREHVMAVAELAEPIDRAVRNARVLVRRVAAATRYREPIPPAYLDLLESLAEATGHLADALVAVEPLSPLRADLAAVAVASGALAPSVSMSATVVLAQVRSIVVDLLELTGLDPDEALDRLPRPAH